MPDEPIYLQIICLQFLEAVLEGIIEAPPMRKDVFPDIMPAPFCPEPPYITQLGEAQHG